MAWTSGRVGPVQFLNGPIHRHFELHDCGLRGVAFGNQVSLQQCALYWIPILEACSQHLF
jgi:hypothetical protein